MTPVAEILAVVEPPAELTAVTVIVLTPLANGIETADHVTIELPGLASTAAPEPPRSLAQVTEIPPMKSVTVPSSLRAEVPVPELEVMARTGFRRKASTCAVGNSAAATPTGASPDEPPPQPANAKTLKISANAVMAEFICNFIRNSPQAHVLIDRFAGMHVQRTRSI